ncbi:MAG: hypothetical protein R3A45_13435 [Bdellovibrionota bacterium]
MKLWMLLVFLSNFAWADHHNIVLAPHSLGQFYEEPTGFRPSMRGMDKAIASFEGVEHIKRCVNKDDFTLLITGALLRHKPSPKLGQKGPEDYPQVKFVVRPLPGGQIELTAHISLWLPGRLMVDQKPKKVDAFAYKHQVSMGKTCQDQVQVLIDEVINTWMGDYNTQNVEHAKK